MAIHFKGIIKKVIYDNYETAEKGISLRDVTVISGTVPPTVDLNRVMCTGVVTDAFPGVDITITGDIDDAGDYPKLRIKKSECEIPKKPAQIIEYLEAGAIPPLHSYAAGKLIENYGGGALAALNAAPEEIVNVLPNITKNQMIKLVDNWKIRRSDLIHDEMFEKFKVPINVRRTLIDRYLNGDKNSFKAYQANPYLYCYHKGTKFDNVDRAVKQEAHHSYFDHPLNPARVMGAIFSELNEAEQRGDTAIKASTSLHHVCNKLGQGSPEHLMTHIIMPSIDKGALYVFEKGGEHYIQRRDWYIKEREIAGNIYRLMSAPNYIDTTTSPIIDPTGGMQHPTQALAVETCLRSNVGIITGGPGTGKTTTLKSLIMSVQEAAKSQGKKDPTILLIAPSGLASVRMNESTGMPTMTIHKAVGAKFGGKVDKGLLNRIDYDVVVIDEISMLDTELLHTVLTSLKSGTRLYMLGDQYQLPSVSAGAVIADMIDSGSIPVGRLTKVFRFDEKSLIGVNAKGIKEGCVENPTQEGADWRFIQMFNPADTAMGAIQTFEKIWRNQNIEPSKIQILCSQKKGATGVDNLNLAIQRLVNPNPAFSDTIKFGRQKYHVGDKVMCKENSKRTGLSNGEIGIVESVHDGVLSANFEGTRVQFNRSQLSSLTLAWALTIHKSQGSEYSHVITPVAKEHERFFTNQKLYTAVTRCKKEMYFIGDPGVFDAAVNNKDGMERITGLEHQIQTRLPKLAEQNQFAVEVAKGVTQKASSQASPARTFH